LYVWMALWWDVHASRGILFFRCKIRQTDWLPMIRHYHFFVDGMVGERVRRNDWAIFSIHQDKLLLIYNHAIFRCSKLFFSEIKGSKRWFM
jgi:hypothetical protein